MTTIKPEFIEMLAQTAYKPFDGLAEELANGNALCSIRTNAGKGVNVPGEADRVAWCPNGLYLPDRVKFTFHPSLHQGLYYVQDASSMALDAVIRHLKREYFGCGQGLRVLDACAAPGGKTSVIADNLPEDSALIANEFDFRRAEILNENIAKWGNPAVAVTRGDTAGFTPLANLFDIICIDAPCSGEGMMRKDPTAAEQWSPSLVSQCSRRQKEIISNLWPALKPGGFLIYSTCTFNTFENEDMVDYMINEFGAETIIVPELEDNPEVFPQAKGIGKCYRFIPGKTRGEGLFISVLLKPDEKNFGQPLGRGTKATKIDRKIISQAAKVLQGSIPADLPLRMGTDKTSLHAPTAALDNLLRIMESNSKVDILSPGGKVIETAGKEFRPAHPLILRQDFNPEAFPCHETDYPTAMSYLRGESLPGIGTLPKGEILLTYGGRPLGWIKNLGNRANNLYPKPWRVLTKNIESHEEDFSSLCFINNY